MWFPVTPRVCWHLLYFLCVAAFYGYVREFKMVRQKFERKRERKKTDEFGKIVGLVLPGEKLNFCIFPAIINVIRLYLISLFTAKV